MKSIFSIFRHSANSFKGKEVNEEVVLLIRRHPFFIIVRLIFFVFLMLVPLIIINLFYDFLLFKNLLEIFFFVYSFWCLFIWSGIFYLLTMYTLDVWIVTDHRIIDSTQNGFFNRTVSELHIARIQDISVQTKGIIQTFIKCGDLQVQTAGTEEKFKFSQISNPMKVKDEIMKLVNSFPIVHPQLNF